MPELPGLPSFRKGKSEALSDIDEEGSPPRIPKTRRSIDSPGQRIFVQNSMNINRGGAHSELAGLKVDAKEESSPLSPGVSNPQGTTLFFLHHDFFTKGNFFLKKMAREWSKNVSSWAQIAI